MMQLRNCHVATTNFPPYEYLRHSVSSFHGSRGLVARRMGDIRQHAWGAIVG